LIQIEGLKKTLNQKRVLDGVQLTIAERETLVIMGPSGTGKSVLLKHIVGLMDPDEGDVLVDGISVASANRSRILQVRERISYVFQNSALFDSLTVRGNIMLGLPEERCNRRDDVCESMVRESLTHVNLEPEVLDLRPAELSGGMQKRVAIARAIVGRQKYILYDEPTTGLDPINAAVITDLIDHVTHDIEGTSVIVTHDVEAAFTLGDRIVLLSNGRIRAEGTPEQLRRTEDAAVRRFLSPSSFVEVA
jgi:phospholipid/cholesterol/gamma-HCH transport system ATP-binding protein